MLGFRGVDVDGYRQDIISSHSNQIGEIQLMKHRAPLRGNAIWPYGQETSLRVLRISYKEDSPPEGVPSIIKWCGSAAFWPHCNASAALSGRGLRGQWNTPTRSTGDLQQNRFGATQAAPTERLEQDRDPIVHRDNPRCRPSRTFGPLHVSAHDRTVPFRNGLTATDLNRDLLRVTLRSEAYA